MYYYYYLLFVCMTVSLPPTSGFVTASLLKAPYGSIFFIVSVFACFCLKRSFCLLCCISIILHRSERNWTLIHERLHATQMNTHTQRHRNIDTHTHTTQSDTLTHTLKQTHSHMHTHAHTHVGIHTQLTHTHSDLSDVWLAIA